MSWQRGLKYPLKCSIFVFSKFKTAKGSQSFPFLKIFIGVSLLYHVVLVAAVQQSESAICTHISPYPLPLQPPSHPPYPIPLGCLSVQYFWAPNVCTLLGVGPYKDEFDNSCWSEIIIRTIKLMFAEYLRCAQHFTCIISFKPTIVPWGVGSMNVLLYRWGKGGSEMLTSLPSTMQVVKRVKISSQAAWL